MEDRRLSRPGPGPGGRPPDPPAAAGLRFAWAPVLAMLLATAQGQARRIDGGPSLRCDGGTVTRARSQEGVYCRCPDAGLALAVAPNHFACGPAEAGAADGPQELTHTVQQRAGAGVPGTLGAAGFRGAVELDAGWLRAAAAPGGGTAGELRVRAGVAGGAVDTALAQAAGNRRPVPWVVLDVGGSGYRLEGVRVLPDTRPGDGPGRFVLRFERMQPVATDGSPR